MIESEKQFEVTSSQLWRLETGLAAMSPEPPENVHPVLWEAARAGLESQISKLKQEIADWQEKLERASNEKNNFDFYYSPTRARLQGFQCHRVNGNAYTETVRAGQEPISIFSDLVLVASATEMSAVSYNSELTRSIRRL